MVTVFLEDSFDAAHWLPNVPEGHKCKNMHGHTYRIRIEVEGTLDRKLGWVVDYADVKAAWEPVKSLLDHQTINSIPGLENSTCENIVLWVSSKLVKSLSGLSRVEIRETERCGAYVDCR